MKIDTDFYEIRKFCAWIPTVIGEESYSKAYENFIEGKNSRSECIVTVNFNDPVPIDADRIDCSLLKDVKKDTADYLKLLLEEMKISIDKEPIKFIIYPKYLYDKHNKYHDSTILMAFDNHNDLNYIIIFECSFVKFIHNILEYSIDHRYGSHDYCGRWEVAYICNPGWDGSNSLVKFDICQLKDKVKLNDRVVASQIYRLLCDVYFIRIFHTMQDVIMDPVLLEDENFAMQKIFIRYLESVASFQEELRYYDNKPFYVYLNYSIVRRVQRSIKLAFGNMILAESFCDLFWDNLPSDYTLAKQKSDYNKRIELSRSSLSILTERIESRWNFTGPITICSSLLLVINAYFFSENAIFNQNNFINDLISNPFLLIVFLLFPMLFFTVLPISSLFVLYFWDQFHNLKRYRKRIRIKIRISYEMNRYSFLRWYRKTSQKILSKGYVSE